MNIHKNSGFTLIEIAIVLMIVTIILGYTVAMFPIQQELKQYRQADREMDQIIDSLYSFAQVNGYLPCPADAAGISNGFECRDLGGACGPGTPSIDTCDIYFGMVPAKTLGLEGKYSDTGLLLDPWGEPYRYQVTDTDGGTGAIAPDFVMIDGMFEEKIANLNPNLSVCNEDPSPGVAGTGDGGCIGDPETVVREVPAVILSTGKNTDGDVAGTSWRQRENLDNNPTDRTFVLMPFNDTSGGEYDDLVKWIAPNILYSKMIQAGKLP